MPCIPGADLKKFALEHGYTNLIYITHPLLLLKESWELSSECELREDSRPVKTFKALHWVLPEPLLYIKDMLYSVFWVLKTKQTYDLYFGINNLNALTGLMLKKIRRVMKVVYYTIDLYPQRFNNPLVNWVYHQMDKFCVRYCDETWNVSPYLAIYRERKGVKGPQHSRQFTVPIGIWFDEMKRVPPAQVKPTKIVYVGHLKAFYGVELAIHALPLIQKIVPKAYLEIIGSGEQHEELRELVNKLDLTHAVKFHGWKEKKRAERLIADAAVGLAPFNTDVDEKIKNADPAKIKDYLALGLPIVMTNATLNAPTIAKLKCGIVVNYTPQSLASAVIKLLSNQKLRKEYGENALAYARQFNWNDLFAKNISRLL